MLISPRSGTKLLLPAGRRAMVDLDFAVDGITVEPYAAIPTLRFALHVINATPALAVENVMLNCQIRIEPARRPYGALEHERLADLFGAPERWGQTLQSFLWTHVNVTAPRFEHDCTVALPVPCSFDFNIAATKYFDGLTDGEAPLALLFSGSVFYRDTVDRLQIAQIPWSKEASCRLPIGLWRQMMDQYYPDSTWLRVPRALFEELFRYKRQRALPTFEAALQALLDTGSAEPAQ
jgi:Family of unknown function (DUF6084)